MGNIYFKMLAVSALLKIMISAFTNCGFFQIKNLSLVKGGDMMVFTYHPQMSPRNIIYWRRFNSDW